jgi:predicted RNase H-like nuclease (RuvC/YqgF family)
MLKPSSKLGTPVLSPQQLNPEEEEPQPRKDKKQLLSTLRNLKADLQAQELPAKNLQDTIRQLSAQMERIKVQNGHLRMKLAKLDQEVRVGRYLQAREEAKLQRKLKMIKAIRYVAESMSCQLKYPEDPKQFIDQMTQELVEEKT